MEGKLYAVNAGIRESKGQQQLVVSCVESQKHKFDATLAEEPRTFPLQLDRSNNFLDGFSYFIDRIERYTQWQKEENPNAGRLPVLFGLRNDYKTGPLIHALGSIIGEQRRNRPRSIRGRPENITQVNALNTALITVEKALRIRLQNVFRHIQYEPIEYELASRDDYLEANNLLGKEMRSERVEQLVKQESGRLRDLMQHGPEEELHKLIGTYAAADAVRSDSALRFLLRKPPMPKLSDELLYNFFSANESLRYLFGQVFVRIAKSKGNVCVKDMSDPPDPPCSNISACLLADKRDKDEPGSFPNAIVLHL